MRGWLVLVVWLWVVAISAQHIRLNMIVKDERRVIERCLRSVRPLIDSWVIVDTGSTDGTQDLIRRLMWEWGMPGRLYEHPWVDFATNRNQALTHALELDAGHADPDSDSDPVDYILFMDADEELVLDPGFQLPCDLDKDFYYILTHYADLRYHRVQLISARVPGWRWQGVVHEAVDSPHAHTHGTLQGVYNQVRPEGSRSTDPDKYRKDAEALFRELVARPHNARTAFYLAQSFRDANDPYNALQWYQKRTHMASAFEEENFYARYQVALLQQQLGFPKEVRGAARSTVPSNPTPSFACMTVCRCWCRAISTRTSIGRHASNPCFIWDCTTWTKATMKLDTVYTRRLRAFLYPPPLTFCLSRAGSTNAAVGTIWPCVRSIRNDTRKPRGFCSRHSTCALDPF